MPRCSECGMPCLEPEEIIEWDGLTFCGALCFQDFADDEDEDLDD